MLKKLSYVVLGLGWFALVFLLGLRWTFPSGLAADRLKYEFHEQTRGDYLVELSSLSPWGLGAQATNLVVHKVGGTRTAPTTTPIFVSESVGISAHPFSWLGRSPRLSGTVQIATGEADFKLKLLKAKRGDLKLTHVMAEGGALPLADLLGMAGQTFGGSGALDIEIDVRSEDGEMGSTNGDIEIRGKDLIITDADVAALAGMPMGRDVPVEELELDIEITEGKAVIKRGFLRSSYAGDLDLSGDITLRTPVTRSALDLDLKAKLGEEVAMFKSFLKDAITASGDVHYKVSGTLSRPYTKPQGEAASRSQSGVSRARPSSFKPLARDAEPIDLEAARAEREKRREELRDRLRTGRPDSLAKRPGVREPADDFDDEEYTDEEEGVEDEPEDDVEFSDDEGEEGEF